MPSVGTSVTVDGFSIANTGSAGGATLANPALTIYQFNEGPKNTSRYSLGATADWRFAPRDVVSIGGSWNAFDAFFNNHTNENANANLSRYFDLGVPVLFKAGVDARRTIAEARRPFRQWTFVGPDRIANNADNLTSNYDLVDTSNSSIAAPYGNGAWQYGSPWKAYDLYKAHPEYYLHDDVYEIQQNTLNSNSRGRQRQGLIGGVAESGTYTYMAPRLTMDVDGEYRVSKSLGFFLGENLDWRLARHATAEPRIPANGRAWAMAPATN